MRRVILLLAVIGLGVALGSGVALSAPASSPLDAQADGALQSKGTIEPLVIGGSPVPIDKFRYIAAVRFKVKPREAYCGGTLIDRDSVLTAAHCTQGIRPGHFRVFTGRTDLSSNKGVARDVKRVFVHPRYAEPSLNHDASVLKLSRPVPRSIPKVKLAAVTGFDKLERGGSYATVAGWGTTIPRAIGQGECVIGESFNFPKRMRTTRVAIASDSDAKYIYNEYLPYYGYECGPFKPRTMVAAGYDGTSTCQGDSGGPLFKEVRRGGKKVHYQIGITSWGAGCGQKGYPSVYAEVNSKQIAPFIKAAARK